MHPDHDQPAPPVGGVVELRAWLLERRRFDDLRRLRPWRVTLHPVTIAESRERPQQLTIGRGWRD